ncbi:hypothetical protein CYMTET_6645 [Cymbomonas tetramitiformis]|uniref:Fucosyltransferase n=1 Tax=Cymbomonas tetramitiformis TaxID=36881 RepID=A0AAE0GX72_9CHLO|nr:hypothetical protein CYMTET_6645 [Cymbomonas tetramitiformis]
MKRILYVLLFHAGVFPLSVTSSNWHSFSKPRNLHGSQDHPKSKVECLLENRYGWQKRFEQLQHPTSCEGDTKFVLYTLPGVGFGANVLGAVGAFHVAVSLGRVFILHTEWDKNWFSSLVNATQCPNKQATQPWECYFLPPSNCTVDDALRITGVDTVDDLLKNRSYWMNGPLEKRTERIIYAGNRFLSQGYIKPDFLPQWAGLHMENKKEVFEAYGLQYLMRPNPMTRHLLEEKFGKVIPRHITEEETVGVPIRGSDKCGHMVDEQGNKKGGTGFEADCLPFQSYLKAFREVQTLDHDARYILLTSDDSRYIARAREHDRLQRASSSSAPPGLLPLRFFFNEDDHPIGSGLSSQAFGTELTSGRGKALTHEEATISMITTLSFQVSLSLNNVPSAQFDLKGSSSASDDRHSKLPWHPHPLAVSASGIR